MTSLPPNTNGWNSARSNFTNFSAAQVNSSQSTTTTTTTTNTNSTTPLSVEETNNNMKVTLERVPPTRDPVRDEYYSHYSSQTGIRIATTLGSFYLFVLLTLLYKSKCKKHSSRSPTPLPGPLLLPPCQPPLPPMPSTSADILHHHQVYPYTSSNNMGGGGSISNNHRPSSCYSRPHPALLLTSANSSSSDEDLSSSTNKPLMGPRFLQSGHGIVTTVNGRKQSIDIHVILPTPTISPSSSEHFRQQEQQPHHHPYYLGDDTRRSSATSSIGTITTYSAGSGHPFTFPDNLKYVDDTSSENIPEVRDSGDDDDAEDQGSLGSDSVFMCCEPPPPPLLPKRRPSASPSSYYSGLDEEWKVTLTQARAQVHHRDSFTSDIESVNDYLEGGGSGGGSGSECNSRRRSSSTQTTMSDLQHCLGLASAMGMTTNATTRTPSPRLSPHHPHHFMSLRQSPVQFLGVAQPTSGGGGNSPRVRGGRKRSVDALLLGWREQQMQQQQQQQQQTTHHGSRFLASVTPTLDQRRTFELVVDPDK